MNASTFATRVIAGLVGEFAAMSRFDFVAAAMCMAVLLYALSRLVLLSRREEKERRLAALKPKLASPTRSAASLDLAGTGKKAWYDSLGDLIASSPVVGTGDRARLRQSLSDAGFRGGKYRVATLVTIKLCSFGIVMLMIWMAVTLYAWLANAFLLRTLVLLAAALLGWRVPDLVLTQLARARKRRIERAFPDALDLLVISAEAGLSLDHGIDFVAGEMRSAAAELGDEFATASAELRVLGDRSRALHNFAKRINLPSVHGVVSTLTQSMRYGTPLAHSLRLLAAEMRSVRLLRMEERAARMPVLLTLPLMGLILPSLVLVVAGPAVLKMIDALATLAK